jgi:hypothetical protein
VIAVGIKRRAVSPTFLSYIDFSSFSGKDSSPRTGGNYDVETDFSSYARVDRALRESTGSCGASLHMPLKLRTRCGVDSTGYTAPGTMTPVDVGGVFALTIAGDAVTQSTATLSIDDGGDGPAVCAYSSGIGSV